jgi:hypothetical protein
VASVVRIVGCLVAIAAIEQPSPGRSAPVCSIDSSGNVTCSGGAITGPITIYDPAAAFQPVNGSNSYVPNNPNFPATGYNPAPPTATVNIGSTASFVVTTNSTSVLADKGLIAGNYSNNENPAVNNVVVNNAGLLSLTTSQIATSRMHDIVSDSQVNNFTVNNTGTVSVTQNFFGSSFNPANLGLTSSGSPATSAATYGGATLNMMSGLYSDDNTNEFIINNSGILSAMGNYTSTYYGRAGSTITNFGTMTNTTWAPGDPLSAGHWAIATWAGANFEALPGTNPDSPLNVVSNIAKNANGALQGTIGVVDTSATTIVNNASGVIQGDILVRKSLVCGSRNRRADDRQHRPQRRRFSGRFISIRFCDFRRRFERAGQLRRKHVEWRAAAEKLGPQCDRGSQHFERGSGDAQRPPLLSRH